MTFLASAVENVPAPAWAAVLGSRCGRDDHLGAMHRFDSGQKALSARELARSDFTCPREARRSTPNQLGLFPSGILAIEQKDAFLAGHQEFVRAVAVPLHRVEVVS